MAFIASACVQMVLASARVPMPGLLDRPAAAAAVKAILLYRCCLSARAGRHCLFRVSCSEHAVSAVSSLGWTEGLRVTAIRLRQCGGAYSISTDVRGHPTLLAADGTEFGHEHLATWLLPDGRGGQKASLAWDGLSANVPSAHVRAAAQLPSDANDHCPR